MRAERPEGEGATYLFCARKGTEAEEVVVAKHLSASVDFVTTVQEGAKSSTTYSASARRSLGGCPISLTLNVDSSV